jgi:hypothetical protein
MHKDSVRETLSQNQSNGHTAGSPIDPAPNPLDLDSLRLDQNFATSVGVRKVLTVVPVRKPNRHEFVRVRPGDEWRINTAVFENKIDREMFVVSQALRDELAEEMYPVVLLLGINRQSDVFLWPARLPGIDGRTNHWHESAMEAATLAETKWVRLAANMGAGFYNVYTAVNENLSEPVWPELSFQQIIELAFGKRLINAADHPVLRSLRGEL